MSKVAAISKKPRLLAGAKVGIPPRHIDFGDYSQGPLDAIEGNKFTSSFLATLSSFFPPGEMFFVDSVRYYRDIVKDEHLKKQISGFIGQEAIHSQEHDRLNAHFASMGYSMKFADRCVRGGLWMLKRFSPKMQLACTAYMEHMTACMAYAMLTEEELPKLFDPDMIRLWQWHAVEEIEHKTVAFEVYRLVGDDPDERRKAVKLVSLCMVPFVLVILLTFMIQRGHLFDFKENRRGWELIVGKTGLVTRATQFMGMFKRNQFHPNDHETDELLKTWREKLFGNDGSLADAVTNRDAIEAA